MSYVFASQPVVVVVTAGVRHEQFASVYHQARHQAGFSSPHRDLSMAAHVDAALQLQSSLGTLCALEFMKAKGIPPQVTARVLGQPQKRRLRD